MNERSALRFDPITPEIASLTQKVADDLVKRGFWEKSLDVTPFFNTTAFSEGSLKMALTLYSSPTSPFARKVRIAILELGLADKVNEITINPFAADADYLVLNPLSKIPTLVTEDGVVIPDSRHILDYVVAPGSGAGRSLAASGGDPWAARRSGNSPMAWPMPGLLPTLSDDAIHRSSRKHGPTARRPRRR